MTRKEVEQTLDNLANEGYNVDVVVDYIIQLELEIEKLEDELEQTEQVLTQHNKRRRQKWDDE